MWEGSGVKPIYLPFMNNLYSHRASVHSTGSDAVVIAYSAIMVAAEQNKSLCRLV